MKLIEQENGISYYSMDYASADVVLIRYQDARTIPPTPFDDYADVLDFEIFDKDGQFICIEIEIQDLVKLRDQITDELKRVGQE